jgi:predicted phosphodiesterase
MPAEQETSDSNNASPTLLTRRAMLRLSGGGLLALGLGAETLISSAAEPAGFRFIVINDIHSRDQRCRPWFQKIAASMRRHQPAFILINGDLCEHGRADQLTAVKDIFGSLGVPLYATVGNHDYVTDTDHTPFDTLFPNSLNYHFEHAGWQFVALDSTQGRQVFLTHIQPHTLAWLDANLPALDRAKPTVLCTHFPLGNAVLCRPLNADEVLNRFDGFNLVATFSGHWHGFAERHFERAIVTNSRCGSWWRVNNDASPQKGYFLCETAPAGLRRQFCVVA